MEFLQQFVVPSSWKTEVKEESSSSEDEEEEEGQDEDASGEDEEVRGETLHILLASQPHKFFVFFKEGKKGRRRKMTLNIFCFLSAGGSGAVPRGAGELSTAALQVHGGQR